MPMRSAVLEHHVGDAREAAHEVRALRVTEVDVDGAAVAQDPLPRHRVGGVGAAAYPGHPGSRVGGELDHVRAEVGEEADRLRPGPDDAEIEDAQPRERLARVAWIDHRVGARAQRGRGPVLTLPRGHRRLVEARRRAGLAPRCLREVVGAAGHAQGGMRARRFGQPVALDGMIGLADLGDGEHGLAGDALAAAQLPELGVGPLPQQVREGAAQELLDLLALFGGDVAPDAGVAELPEDRMMRPLRVAEADHEVLPVPRHLRHDREVPVLRRPRPPDAAADLEAVALRRQVAEVDDLRDAVTPDREVRGLEAADVDELALAGLRLVQERGQDRAGELHRAVVDVGSVERGVERFALRVAHTVGDARPGVGVDRVAQPLGIGSGEAVDGRRREDEAGPLGEQRVRVEAHRARLRGTHAEQQHVGAVEQALQRRAVLGTIEVQPRALLAAVEVDEEAALLRPRFVVREGAVQAQLVAVGRLDLDHLGAEVAQQLAAVGELLALADLDDADALERVRHRPDLDQPVRDPTASASEQRRG